MTIQQTLQTIKALGLSARWSSEYREFRINLKGGSEATAYYTESAIDAITTAKKMADREFVDNFVDV